MKKILLMVFSIIILTGCSAEYNIKFDKNMNVEEELFAYESDAFYESYSKSSYNRVISFILEPNLEYFNNNDYSIVTDSFDGDKGAKISRKFKDINEYKETSKIYKQAVDEIEYEEVDGIVTIKAKVSINFNEQDQEKYNVENLKLNINLPFVVKSSNADKVKKNTYTWTFDKDNSSREIEIVFNKNKLNIDYTPYIIIGGIVLFIIIVYVYFKNKIKNRNKINEI